MTKDGAMATVESSASGSGTLASGWTLSLMIVCPPTMDASSSSIPLTRMSSGVPSSRRPMPSKMI